MTASAPTPASRSHAATALFLAVGMAAIVGGALGFQHVGGYIPCKLCLEQRLPYYLGIPLMLLAALSAVLRWPAALTRLLFVAGGLLMAWNVYMGVFHSGVEWGWWPGPTDCGAVAAPADTGGNGVLDALDQFVPPSCDKAALRIFGLSLAGWSALASLFFAAVSLRGALARG